MCRLIPSLLLRMIVAFFLLAGLVSCDSLSESLAFGEGGNSGTGIDEGGTSGTGVTISGVASGPISTAQPFSSGGVVYNTDKAIISFNGQPADESQLETGMIVVIDGEVNDEMKSGTAQKIRFRHKLVGEIDSVNIAANTLVSLGQKIIFDEYTRFKNVTADSLSVTDLIAVSGLTEKGGNIRATYIEKVLTASSDVILDGVLTSLNVTNKTFEIGEQLVDYSIAQQLGITDIVLLEGSTVRVIGVEVADGQSQTETAISASSIETVDNILEVELDDGVRIEGLVSQVASSTNFIINANVVQVESDTQFINGDAFDIKIDARMFVKGVINSRGVIVAESIRYILPSAINIEAQVESIDVITGTVNVLGKAVSFDAFTLLLDKSDANITNMTISNIAIQDRLLIQGQLVGDDIEASVVERVNSLPSNSFSSITSIVEDSISNPLFSLAGIRVDTSEVQDGTGFSQGSVSAISSSAFYASLQPEMLVNVQGEYAAGVLSPNYVEIVHCCNWEVYDSFGTFVGGGNDVVFTWDGTFNTSVFDTNVNASISSNTTIAGQPVASQDIRIFGPGTYNFDTGLNPGETTNFDTTNLGGNIITLTVGPNQMGAHGLFHFGDNSPTGCGQSLCNIDTVLLWNINAVYEGSEDDDSHLGSKGKLFNLSAVDHDNDGVPGVPVVEQPFKGLRSVYNLNFTSP